MSEKYAIIETGGKQYRVEEGSAVLIERLPDRRPGERVEFDRVLLVRDGSEVKVGTPYVEGAAVVAEIAEELKGEKIRVFKHKPKKRYRRRQGHRQIYMKALIQEIRS